MTFGGEVLHLSYRPGIITPAFGQEVVHDNASPVARLLEECLTKWDLEADDGEPYPITRDALMQLPSNFLAAVQDAIFTDLAPSKKA